MIVTSNVVAFPNSSNIIANANLQIVIGVMNHIRKASHILPGFREVMEGGWTTQTNRLKPKYGIP